MVVSIYPTKSSTFSRGSEGSPERSDMGTRQVERSWPGMDVGVYAGIMLAF